VDGGIEGHERARIRDAVSSGSTSLQQRAGSIVRVPMNVASSQRHDPGMRRKRFLALLGVAALGSATGARLARSHEPRDVPDEGRDLPDDEVENPLSGLQRIIWSVDTKAPVVALTFDDGPDPEFTPRIVDVLDRYKVTATFMVMGYNAVRHAELLREIVAAGHEIGGHGWHHLNLAKASVAETRTEIEFGTRMIEERAGVPVRVFRPPYGRFNEAAVRLLALREHDMVVWSVTRGKLAWQEADQVASHVVGSVGPGDIVDLHDGIGRGTFNPGTEFAERLRRRRAVEVAALPRILEGLRARGLRLKTVSGLVAAGRPSDPSL
jgi:peptidoglycan-N-acetylglucosamine deacetylase